MRASQVLTLSSIYSDSDQTVDISTLCASQFSFTLPFMLPVGSARAVNPFQSECSLYLAAACVRKFLLNLHSARVSYLLHGARTA